MPVEIQKVDTNGSKTVIVLQAFRYELDPNNIQGNLLARHAGCARFAYNWGLERRIKEYQLTKRSSNAIKQHKELNALKKSQFPWMYEVSKCAPQEALRNLDRAYQGFFRRMKNGEKPGFPKFKKKGLDDKFRLTGSIRIVDDRHVKLPSIGIIKTKESTDKFHKFKGKILAATVKCEANRWYVSLQVEVERNVSNKPHFGVIGIDLNTGEIVIWNGTNEQRIQLPKPLTRLLNILTKRSKAHSKKVKGSNNRRKTTISLSRLHRKIKNIRLDFFRKLSTELAKTTLAIGVEGLNIKGMVRNQHLSRSISDSGWGIFLTMLQYKSTWYGSVLIEAPPYFPSTKMCFHCGYVVDEMPLWKRIFECPKCGLTIDRDTNAARNLRNYTIRRLAETGILITDTGSSPGSYACGDWTSIRPETDEQVRSTKQEKSASVT